MSDLSERLDTLRERIRGIALRHGRDPSSVALVAVSKTQPSATVRLAVEAGQRAFGENYPQELVAKATELAGLGIEWHFVGHLQANKTRLVAGACAWVHTIDSIRIAERLSAQRSDALPALEVCLQLRLDDEPTKHGVLPGGLVELADAVAALPRLRLRGLMTLPAPEPDPERQRLPFRRLREQLDALRARGHRLDTLSMGTTSDLEAAIAEGATLLRVGTALFGERGQVLHRDIA